MGLETMLPYHPAKISSLVFYTFNGFHFTGMTMGLDETTIEAYCKSKTKRF